MLRVLLVEDEPIIQQIHREYLEELGCKVQVAVNGTQALELAKETVDLILMDIGLPDISGIEVAKKIRESDHKNRSVPIIFLTAFAHHEIQEEYLKYCCDCFYSKPLNIDQLEKIIEKIKLITPAVTD